jgi:aspartate kinase
MKVFKFGGASVRDANAVNNITEILKMYPGEKLVVVISAMGKTTNNLEMVVKSHFNNDGNSSMLLDEIKLFHKEILMNLFPSPTHPVFDMVNNIFVEIEWVLDEQPAKGFDFAYDQIVSAGELISTRIVSEYLKSNGVENNWLDARDVNHTDNNYREANVNWELTEKLTGQRVSSIHASGINVVITQGFIGSTSENYSITLGREGSDYSSAILAYCLNADAVYIWKDVQGVLNADPKYFKDAQKLEKMSYHDDI